PCSAGYATSVVKGDNSVSHANGCISSGLSCYLGSATSEATGDNSASTANACVNTPDCIVSTATAKAAKGGNADSNACVNTPSCGNADATAKARGGNADVTVLALETGKAHAGHGGTAI